MKLTPLQRELLETSIELANKATVDSEGVFGELGGEDTLLPILMQLIELNQIYDGGGGVSAGFFLGVIVGQRSEKLKALEEAV